MNSHGHLHCGVTPKMPTRWQLKNYIDIDLCYHQNVQEMAAENFCTPLYSPRCTPKGHGQYPLMCVPGKRRPRSPRPRNQPSPRNEGARVQSLLPHSEQTQPGGEGCGGPLAQPGIVPPHGVYGDRATDTCCSGSLCNLCVKPPEGRGCHPIFDSKGYERLTFVTARRPRASGPWSAHRLLWPGPHWISTGSSPLSRPRL